VPTAGAVRKTLNTISALAARPAHVLNARSVEWPAETTAVSNIPVSYRFKMKFTWIGACTSTGCPLSNVGA
jgi:hypothetical protein